MAAAVEYHAELAPADDFQVGRVGQPHLGQAGASPSNETWVRNKDAQGQGVIKQSFS